MLDPFCGGGVTIVEALKLRRKAVGVDVNPMATYVTSMECTPANLQEFRAAFIELSEKIGDEISSLYQTRCNKCGSVAIADWFEWDEKASRIIRLKFDCPRCGSAEKSASRSDQSLAAEIERDFQATVRKRDLWFPATRIPRGDKTDSMLARNFESFDELFTKRNLMALSILRKEIANSSSISAKDLLSFTLSSSLKWASRQSHLRGKIVEGWAMHAYWVYAKSLELNVWNVFKRRYNAIDKGKNYSNEHIGTYGKIARGFDELLDGNATCLILMRSAAELPIPDSSIDAVITDPPYGGNVNYAELADYWYIWMNNGKTIEKEDEVVINRTQQKSLHDYEQLLAAVFQECYRVLKPHRYLVSTFNSKDFRVVASFILAASRAGFALSPTGVVYQKPIRAYTTTFHAMQIGAFVGDFIFTFKKEAPHPKAEPATAELQRVEGNLTELVDQIAKGGGPEPKLREQAYAELIPFLAKHAASDEQACRDAVGFFENKIREHENYFKGTRKKLIEARKREFTDH